jgi:hypothetical protein
MKLTALLVTTFMRRHVPPKRRLIANIIHGVVFQKIELFITTAVKASNHKLPKTLFYTYTLKNYVTVPTIFFLSVYKYSGHCKQFSPCLYLSMSPQPFLGPWTISRFLIFYTVSRTPWTGDQPVTRPLPTHRTIQTQNKRPQTSMHQVGFELTIPAFERAKTVHALDRAATVIGSRYLYLHTKCGCQNQMGYL